MQRKRINLRTLPLWQQYLIALSITVFVVTIAWLVSRGVPSSTSSRIEYTLAPILGWLFIILVLCLILGRFIRRTKL